MALIRLQDVTVGFGGPPVLAEVALRIEAGERVCLLGRNGMGKSTLLKLIGGELAVDAGRIEYGQNLVVAGLAQTFQAAAAASVFEVVADGLGERGAKLKDYHALSHRLAQGDSKGGSGASLKALEMAQQELEAGGGWQLNQRVETILSRLSLAGDAAFDALSGGLKRRVLLARALVQEPDLLLLDEPTNHLDIEAIDWLESLLLSYRAALLFVTHDRRFLERLATRILELDRGDLTSWPGDYARFRERKQAALEAEAAAQARHDKRLSREEAWIRQGIKARRTRNEGRVRALEELRTARRARRDSIGALKLDVPEAERSGKLVIEATGVRYGYGGSPLVADLTTTILRGDRVGVLGPNGCGKTTLLRLLLGELAPQAGSIRHGTGLDAAYFDQHRSPLDDAKTVRDTVAEGRDRIEVKGGSRHVISYLRDFLFPPERADTPVGVLSGGERNRLMLARLLARPRNLLVMDEPTNDLDLETLELLEEWLIDYPGTLLLVSHDRAFINNVVTSTLVFEGAGRVQGYIGGYDDWLRQRAAPEGSRRPATQPAKARTPRRARKLAYHEQCELEALPARIEALEVEQNGLQGQLSDPAFYNNDGATIARATERLQALEQELREAYDRWEALEALQQP